MVESFRVVVVVFWMDIWWEDIALLTHLQNIVPPAEHIWDKCCVVPVSSYIYRSPIIYDLAALPRSCWFSEHHLFLVVLLFFLAFNCLCFTFFTWENMKRTCKGMAWRIAFTHSTFPNNRTLSKLFHLQLNLYIESHRSVSQKHAKSEARLKSPKTKHFKS